MFEAFQEMISYWDDPSMRHAMVVHSPIVLSFIVVPLVLASVIMPRRAVLRIIALLMLIAMTVSAFIARDSGFDAEGSTGAAISEEASSLITRHANLGSLSLFISAGVTLLFALTAVPKKPFRVTTSILSSAGCLFLAGWIAIAASLGGKLVYEHGVGVKRPQVVATNDNGDEASEGTSTDARLAFFREKVQPVLDSRCWGCHRPGRQEGELDLTSFAGMRKGGEYEGPAVTPGKPDESSIVLVINYDHITQMPPSNSGGKLPDDQIAALVEWIEDGAVWEDPPVLRNFDEEEPDADDDAEEQESAAGSG